MIDPGAGAAQLFKPCKALRYAKRYGPPDAAARLGATHQAAGDVVAGSEFGSG